MAQRILKGVNSFLDISTLFIFIFGGVIFHLLTAFAVKGTCGGSWGVMAFIFPGVAELGYAAYQLADGNLKYPVLLSLYIALVAGKIMLLYGKKAIVRRLRRRYEPAELF